ncbi:MAG: hypothetical protein PVI99_00050 [Anaerolineales bacterium]|jgi:hypothetical protein
MPGDPFTLYLNFIDTANAFSGALHQPLQQELESFFEREDAAKGADGLYAQVAVGASPDEVNFKELLDRNPYSNPQKIKSDLKAADERGWITLTDTGFSATQKAGKFTDELVGILVEYAAMREADLEVDIPRIVSLLGRLVESAQTTDVFSNKPSFTFARNYEYEDKTPSLLWVRRHLITMGNYRDDCHIASWKSLDLPGYHWEAFTFIWQDQAHTATELAEKLTFRGYDENDYATALAKLAELGWVEEADGAFTLTEKGVAVREDAETRTNQYYKAAFEVLSEAEITELSGLIQSLIDTIKIEEGEEAQPA